MAQIDDSLMRWLGARHEGVLVTLRTDGSPQTSNIVFDFLDGNARVSVTDGRAKTHNLRRDPRGVLHVLGDNFWSYASVSVMAELSPVSETPGDATGLALLSLHDSVQEAHPDPQEFFAAMVRDRRLLLTLHPTSATAMGTDA